ncbi:MAG: tRNA 2-thiouridine(34) synthase MnmA [Treponema sp.]|nr:tRNA 2-thiouridine(34) synthase MnmA [Treponema sp.]MCL2251626.1 tRNA 2-thiouridine(34) synthase MnmA [Treponema sp.]
MSGGVDSSVAAALMLEQGFQCVGITLKLYKGESRCCSLADVNDARSVAHNLGMDHYVLNFTEEFDTQVVRHFTQTYEQGATPNPCIECNRHIKFNLLLLRTRQLDFDLLVTGHYARTSHDSASGRFLLLKALDEKKDQSYVLYCLTQQQLQRSRFPLGELSKNEVRKIAEERNFANAAKNESQDICFVPDGDYGRFIEEYTGKIYPTGDIIDLEGKVIGKHKGLIRYTIGQRRGLGVAANVPVYVVSKSIQDNTVTLAPDSALFSKSLTANDINLIACENLKKPMRVTVKTRYLQTEQSAVAEQTGDNTLHIEFDKPQRAITSGQAVVMYDGDIVIGGGTIC